MVADIVFKSSWLLLLSAGELCETAAFASFLLPDLAAGAAVVEAAVLLLLLVCRLAVDLLLLLLLGLRWLEDGLADAAAGAGRD